MKNLVFTYNKERRNHEEYEGFVFESDKKVKQADVVLLNYPLNWKMPADILFNDLLFYEEVTDDNGPAMTWSIFAIKYFSNYQKIVGLILVQFLIFILVTWTWKNMI